MIKANINYEEELREKIIELALLQHAKKYIHGDHGPDSFDCAGLVWYIYNELLNIDIYREGYGVSTTTQIMTSQYGTLTLYNEQDFHKDLSLIKRGDIIFLHKQSIKDDQPRKTNKYPGHCGIYLGNNYFIHSSRIKERVVISNFLKNEYWQKVLVGSKDIVSDEKALRKALN